LNDFIEKCPFCGEYTSPLPIPNKISPYVKKDNVIQFQCGKCHAQGPRARNKEEAWEKWKDRRVINNNSCPFCGSSDFGIIRKFTGFQVIKLFCKKCFAEGPDGVGIGE
jgi:transcription elongation factor Elf1